MLFSIRSTLIALCGTLLSLMAVAHETVIARTNMNIEANFPEGEGPFPTVILAPGAGYHMALPLMVDMAKQMLERGIAVYRFDWTYFSADPDKGRPSKDLITEKQDMSFVLTQAREDKRVAKDKIFLAGKSLGSGVAWSLLASDNRLRAAIMLTPICSSVKAGQVASVADQNYPGIAMEKRPLLFIAGDQDAACAPALLYRFAATAAGVVRVSVIGGNHSFANPDLQGEPALLEQQRNTRLAAVLAADFVAEYSRR